MQTIRYEQLDNLIDNAIDMWKEWYPQEYARFIYAFSQYKAAREAGQSTKDEIWMIGQIPPHLEYMVFRVIGKQWTPELLTRFFSRFKMGRIDPPRSNVFHVSRVV